MTYIGFAQLAQHLGQQIVYVGGKPASAAELHSAFQIDVNDVQKLVAEFMA